MWQKVGYGGSMDELRLSGTFEHTLDTKGRVTLPARYRDHFQGGAVLVRPPDNEPCVSVFHPDTWLAFDDKFFEPLDVADNKTHAWRTRTSYMNSYDVELDGQGRVLIPASHIKRAGLSGRVTIIGARTHLEIWDPDRLAERLQQMESGSA
jgi:MraZ protein